MPNVYEGQPDARQSTDENLPVSRFRQRYRAMSLEEVAKYDAIKEAFAAVETEINKLPSGRYRSLAMTELEMACMWSIKALTE